MAVEKLKTFVLKIGGWGINSVVEVSPPSEPNDEAAVFIAFSH